MASSYTSRIRLEQQGDGENPNSWGAILNQNVISLVDDAIGAYTTIGTSGSQLVNDTRSHRFMVVPIIAQGVSGILDTGWVVLVLRQTSLTLRSSNIGLALAGTCIRVAVLGCNSGSRTATSCTVGVSVVAR